MRSASIDGARHDVDDALAIEAQVEEDAVIAELQVAVDEADLAPELAVQGDGGVDRDGRRARRRPWRRRTRGSDPVGGRASSVSRGAKRASRLLIRASSSAGWNGLIR